MSVIDEIKDRLDIVDVISAYVPLKKAGRNYKGLCPFHNEKTPSFVVFPDDQHWHCFGACNTGGDIFSFVMKRENLDFGEALALLAAKAGVELKPRDAAPAEDAHRERLAAIVADAAVYYHYLLNRAGEAGIARAYLERRGLTPATWEGWQLGYSLDSWDALRDRLLGKGYGLDEIEEAGLVIRRDDGSGCYDRFRGRLMIPIRDVQGRTVGFGARILREDPDHPSPKYINSPQTPLFDKGALLFGLDRARKAIREARLAVIVEGYMDVLMSHQVGVSNVVAGMGTALSEAQMRQLKRYSSNITLALDPDAAGDHAVLRGLEAARESLEREWQPVISPTGLIRQESRLKAQLRIAALPDGLDPDELAYRDADGWRRVIADAKPIVDYYLAVVGREEDLSSARGKSRAVERLAPLIQEIADPIERTHYTQVLSRLVQVPEQIVARQVAVARRSPTLGGATSGQPGEQDAALQTRQSEPPAPAAARAPEAPAKPGSAEFILGYLLLRPDLLPDLDAELIRHQAPPIGPDDFDSAENRAILVSLQSSAHRAGPTEDLQERLAAMLPPALQDRGQALLDDAQGRPSLAEERLLKDLVDSLLRVRERILIHQSEQIQFLYLDAEQANSRDEARQYHALVAAYTAQRNHIQKLLRSRSMAGAVAARAGRTPAGPRPGDATHDR